MKTKYLNLLFTLFTVCTFGQTDRINPKQNLYFGANLGINQIDSRSEKPKSGFHAGVFAEYYFAKQWSLTGKTSYFETGLDFYNQSYSLQSRGPGGGSSNLERQTFSANFSGTVLATSLQIKWEFRIKHNFKGYLKMGYGYYFETQSNYKNYVGDRNEANYPTSYGGWISGMGLTYFFK